jgi:hypothetical protein
MLRSLALTLLVLLAACASHERPPVAGVPATVEHKSHHLPKLANSANLFP